MTTELSLKNHLMPAASHSAIQKKLSKTTYVGIDFGTSTTVASYVTYDFSRGFFNTAPIPIAQQLPNGLIHRHHLVPTVLAWYGGQLLFGEGAIQAPSRTQGRNFWSSFKMQLGLDLGPLFHDSQLGEGHPLATILTPKDAAREFLRFLKRGIEEQVANSELPEDIHYSVSIPASFEANQRRDLADALRTVGIKVNDSLFVDEPNAAFFSYFSGANQLEEQLLSVPDHDSVHVLVFDFGAGTCDISILEVREENQRLMVKNISISRFEALGGNNIDRMIAREVLLPQIEQQNGVDPNSWRTPDLKKRIFPVIQAMAEQLKIRLCKQVARNSSGTNLPDFATSENTVSLPGQAVIRLPRGKIILEQPHLGFKQFSDIMARFLDQNCSCDDKNDTPEESVISVFTPIRSALQKARLAMDEIDVLLLIGGSSENPYLQEDLNRAFGEDLLVIPQDLRSHVSIGAALNSFMLDLTGHPCVQPVTSESVMIITRDSKIRTLIPAGTEMPSAPFLIEDLQVAENEQREIEIPICVSGPDKILSVIHISSENGSFFKKGEPVQVTGSLTIDKLLSVEAKVAGKTEQPEIISPFANRELTNAERDIIMAKKKVYEEAAQFKKPTCESLKELAEAYGRANNHLRAAETYEALHQFDPDGYHETSICYHWSCAEREDLSKYWGKKAYEHTPNAVTAYNLALSEQRDGNIAEFERLMMESLKYNPRHAATLSAIGHHFLKTDNDRGYEFIREAFSVLKEDFVRGNLSGFDDYQRLVDIAAEIGERGIALQALERIESLKKENSLFNPGNLLKSQHIDSLISI